MGQRLPLWRGLLATAWIAQGVPHQRWPQCHGEDRVKVLQVNSQRLERTIDELASIGRGVRGITRLALTAEDLRARRYVMDLMESA